MSLGLLASFIKISILSYTDFFLLVIYLKLDFFFFFFCFLYVCVSSFMSDVLRIISECQLYPSIACFSLFFFLIYKTIIIPLTLLHVVRAGR